MESHLPRSDRFCRQLPITSSRSTPCSLETQAVTGQVVAGLLGECTTRSRTLLSFRKEVLDAVPLLGHTSCLSLSPISGTSPSKEGLSGRGGGPMVQDPSFCSALIVFSLFWKWFWYYDPQCHFSKVVKVSGAFWDCFPCLASCLIAQQICMVAKVGERVRNLLLCSDECSGFDTVLKREELSKDRPNGLYS